MQRSIDALYAASVPAIGWIAAILVLSGYMLMMSKKVSPDGVVYLALNAAGSFGLGLTTIAAHAWQSAVVNVLWLAFGIAPLGRAVASKVRRVRRARAKARAKAAEVRAAGAVDDSALWRFAELRIPAPVTLRLHRGGRRSACTPRTSRRSRRRHVATGESDRPELTRAA
jgi:hypothetical protein